MQATKNKGSLGVRRSSHSFTFRRGGDKDQTQTPIGRGSTLGAYSAQILSRAPGDHEPASQYPATCRARHWRPSSRRDNCAARRRSCTARAGRRRHNLCGSCPNFQPFKIHTGAAADRAARSSAQPDRADRRRGPPVPGRRYYRRYSPHDGRSGQPAIRPRARAGVHIRHQSVNTCRVRQRPAPSSSSSWPVCFPAAVVAPVPDERLEIPFGLGGKSGPPDR